MKRRAKFADAAAQWFAKNKTRGPVNWATLWGALNESHPEWKCPIR